MLVARFQSPAAAPLYPPDVMPHPVASSLALGGDGGALLVRQGNRFD